MLLTQHRSPRTSRRRKAFSCSIAGLHRELCPSGACGPARKAEGRRGKYPAKIRETRMSGCMKLKKQRKPAAELHENYEKETKSKNKTQKVKIEMFYKNFGGLK
jgi:hypothetical protein